VMAVACTTSRRYMVRAPRQRAPPDGA